MSLLCSACLLSSTASATADGPDFYQVKHVARDDVLNIRSQPHWQANKVGEIPADGRCIKNLGCQGGVTFAEFSGLDEAAQKQILRHRPRWCRIDYQGVTGWVAGRYLAEGSCQPGRAANTQAAYRSPANTGYLIEGLKINLKNGYAATPIADSSASLQTKLVTEPLYVGNSDIGRTAVVVLVQQAGGTGSFYYLSAVDTGHAGAPADIYAPVIFIGDRIKLEKISYQAPWVVLDYLDHGAGQPMSEPPASHRQRRFMVEHGYLLEQKSTGAEVNQGRS